MAGVLICENHKNLDVAATIANVHQNLKPRTRKPIGIQDRTAPHRTRLSLQMLIFLLNSVSNNKKKNVKLNSIVTAK